MVDVLRDTNYYLVYKGGAKPFETDIKLKTEHDEQFIPHEVGQLLFHLNPAHLESHDIDQARIPDRKNFLTWYDMKIKKEGPFEVKVKNIFGVFLLKLDQSKSVLIPTQTEPFSEDKNHYKVYRVTNREERLVTISVTDDLFDRDWDRVIRPLFFAIPAEKAHKRATPWPIEEGDIHYTFFELDRNRNVNRRRKYSNQFEDGKEFEAAVRVMLAVPSVLLNIAF